MNTKRHLTLLVAMTITLSNFAQSTWYQMSVPTGQNLNDIQFVTDQVGYIGGDSLALLKTIDGGLTWNEVNHQGLANQMSADHIQEIEFTSELIGYVTLENGPFLYKTIDGGLNWAQVQNNQILPEQCDQQIPDRIQFWEQFSLQQ